MRTTVTLDEDVAAAVTELQREHGIGVSAAVNRLARAGLVRAPERRPFEQRTSPMGARLDVTNIAETLDLIDGPSAR